MIFPVTGSKKRTSIPWNVAEAYRSEIEAEYGATLERLAATGGFDIIEAVKKLMKGTGSVDAIEDMIDQKIATLKGGGLKVNHIGKLVAALAVAASMFLSQPADAQSIGGNASLSVTTVTGRVALPSTNRTQYPVALIAPAQGNAVGVFYRLGDNTVTAATSGPAMPVGGICVALGPNTYVAAITASGSATINITQLTTCPNFSGLNPSGSSTPSGAAGGDLAGTYPNPTLAWISRSASQTLAIGAGGTLGAMAFSTDAANLTGTVACARLPALTGDITTSAGSCATSLASTIAGAKTFSTSVAIGAGSAITSSGPGGALTASAYAAYTGPYLPLAGGTLTGALAVNLNTAGAPIPISGTALQVVGADSTVGRVQVNSFGAIAAVSVTRANGTGASPTAVVSGDQLGGFNSYGYRTSGGNGYSGPSSSVQSFATENWTSTATGTKIVLATTPNLSTTLTTALTIDQSGTVIWPALSTVNSAEFYNTADQTTNYEKLSVSWSSNVATIAVTKGGTGSNRVLKLDASSTLQLSTGGGSKFNVVTDLASSTSGGGAFKNQAASATAPTFAPNSSDGTTGIGAQAAGNLSLIAGATERVRIATNAASVSDVLWPGTLFTGGTATTTFPQLFVQPTGTTAVTTWSTAGTILGMNVVSGFTGNYLDFHAAGGGSSFSVNNIGTITTSGSITIASGGNFSWSGRGIISSPAAGSVQLGAIDNDLNASIVAQTLRTQGALTGGTADQAGKNFTVIVSPGKGTGAGGSYIVQTAPAGSTGTTVNTPVTALTIDSTGAATFVNDINAGSAGLIRWTSRAIMSSPTAASLQLGGGDSDTNAGIAAQTLRTQGTSTGGTTNQAGKDFTIIVSPGKGTGAGGSFIVQTAPAGGSGSTPNSPVTALTIASTGIATFSAGVASTSKTTGTVVVTGGLGVSGTASANDMWVATDNSSGELNLSSFPTKINSPSDGVIKMTNAARTDFSRLQFGGTTSSFPALARVSASLSAVLADNSGDAVMNAKSFTASGGAGFGYQAAAGGAFSWVGRTTVSSTADGQYLIQPTAGTNGVKLGVSATDGLLTIGTSAGASGNAAGTVNAGAYQTGGVAGVDCTGITAGTVTVAKGIVTHCFLLGLLGVGFRRRRPDNDNAEQRASA